MNRKGQMNMKGAPHHFGESVLLEEGGLLRGDSRLLVHEISGVYVKDGYLKIEGYIKN